MAYMMILPFYFHGLKNGLILFAVGHLICGEVLATMFIVNHVIEGVAFAQKDNRTASGAASKPTTPQGITPMDETQKNLMNDSIKIPCNDWAAVQVRQYQLNILI